MFYSNFREKDQSNEAFRSSLEAISEVNLILDGCQGLAVSSV